MAKYRYEMHVHCVEGSACGKSTAAEMVRAFADAGYAGFVLTDHSVCGNARVGWEYSWEERIASYRDAYLSAKAVGDAIGFTVLFGWEHHYARGKWESVYGHGKEVLTYGITPEFLLAHPEIAECSLEEYLDLVHSVGGLVVHAHPFRVRGYIDTSIPPVFEGLDGLEIYNAGNNPEDNLPAYRKARELGLSMISGADAHHTEQNVGLSGMEFDAPIHNNDELVAAIRAKIGRPVILGKVMQNEAETEQLLTEMLEMGEE